MKKSIPDEADVNSDASRFIKVILLKLPRHTVNNITHVKITSQTGFSICFG